MLFVGSGPKSGMTLHTRCSSMCASSRHKNPMTRIRSPNSSSNRTDSAHSLPHTCAAAAQPHRRVQLGHNIASTKYRGPEAGRPLAGVRGQRPRSSETKCGFKNTVYTQKMKKFT
eukprot:366483-Chlamydomonas_euryale.AAC.1